LNKSQRTQKEAEPGDETGQNGREGKWSNNPRRSVI